MALCQDYYLRRSTLRNVRNSLLILGIPLLTSCSSMDSHFLNNNRVVYFNPVVNSEYKYDIEDVDEVIQAMGKNENRTRVISRRRISLLYKILQKSKKGYTISINFLSCEIENGSDVIATNTELPKNDSTYFHKNINSLNGTIFKLNLALGGEIENISGYKEYLNKNSASNEKPYSQNYFNEIFNLISEILPGHKIVIGSSWKPKSLQANTVEYQTNNYVLENMNDSLAQIRFSSQIKQQVSARDVTLVMDGVEHREIEVDINTGMPLNYDGLMKLGGTCKIGGVDVAQTAVKTFKVLGRRIN